MKNLFFAALVLVVLSSCKSKVCECADIHIKAVKEINKVSDPVQKMKVLSAKKYQVPFEKCNKMTESMTPEELKAFEEEYMQCPSIKEYKRK
ncbi:MAG: hypothetical protein RL365_968 [Bacteroidota bacterium]|jgi:hypothetical protein